MKNNRWNLNLSLTENGSKHSEKKTCGLNGKRERQILKVSKSKGAQLKTETDKKGRREKIMYSMEDFMANNMAEY